MTAQPAQGGMFRSLKIYNYRLWTLGALISNVGAWMQRIAQDWLVLTVLTHHNATAVGITTAMQFAPQLVLLPITGYVADHWDRRKLLLATQAATALLALILGVMTLTNHVTLYEVYGLALLLGIVTAFDGPVRMVFVSELVDDTHLANAVALNATSFNAARMIGPALAGVVIDLVGIGAAFIVNAAAILAACATLILLRTHELHREDRTGQPKGSIADGIKYIARRPDLRAVLWMLALFGAFGLNFAVFTSTMSVKIFHLSAGQFGLLTAAMAVGSIVGSVLAARRDKPRIIFLVVGALLFGIAMALAAVMPNWILFGILMAMVGVAAQTVTTSATGLVQLETERAMRGRVMAIALGITVGSMAIGAPIIGWVADAFSPRWGLGVGAAAGLIAAAMGYYHLHKERRAGLSDA